MRDHVIKDCFIVCRHMEAKTLAHEAFSVLCMVFDKPLLFLIFVNMALCAIMETLSI